MRIRAAKGEAYDALGRGRPRLASEMMEQCVSIARAEGLYGDVQLCLVEWAEVAAALEDLARLRAVRAAMDTVLTAPELSSGLRDSLSVYALFMDGVIGALGNDFDALRSAMARLESLSERIGKQRSEFMLIQLGALAAWESGDISLEVAMYRGSGGCLSTHQMGRRRMEWGQRGAAARLLQVVDGSARCRQTELERWAQADARVRLAELNPEESALHLAALRELWPDAEADNPIILRALALAGGD